MAERKRVCFLRGSSPRRVISSEETEPTLVVEDLENVLAWGGGDTVVPSRACECVPEMLDIGHRSEPPAGERTRRPHIGRGLRWAAGIRICVVEGFTEIDSGLKIGLRSSHT